MLDYIREISAEPLLDAATECQLAYRIRANGDKDAHSRMVRANLRLVVNIARRFRGRGLSFEDLISEGNIGLLRAVDGFDPSKNVRFSTYAVHWIKQAIRRAVVNTSKTIRLPSYLYQLLNEWRRAADRLTASLNRQPEQEEIAAYLELSPKKFRVIKAALAIDIKGCDGTEPGRNEADVEPVNVPALLDEVNDQEKTVLRLRFGLEGAEQKTLKEIGESFGVTRERVRQIESRALAKLRQKVCC